MSEWSKYKIGLVEWKEKEKKVRVEDEGKGVILMIDFVI